MGFAVSQFNYVFFLGFYELGFLFFPKTKQNRESPFPKNRRSRRCRGRMIAICNGWSKIEPPHFLFSHERKENGPFTVQKKRAFERCGARLWMVLLETRSPNRLASAPNPAAAAAAGGMAGPFFKFQCYQR